MVSRGCLPSVAMNRSLTFLLTAAALAVAIPAGLAAACTPTTSDPLFETDDGHYIVHDLCTTGCLFAVRLYEESNGLGGLQRRDMRVDDTCFGMIQPDHLLV